MNSAASNRYVSLVLLGPLIAPLLSGDLPPLASVPAPGVTSTTATIIYRDHPDTMSDQPKREVIEINKIINQGDPPKGK